MTITILLLQAAALDFFGGPEVTPWVTKIKIQKYSCNGAECYSARKEKLKTLEDFHFCQIVLKVRNMSSVFNMWTTVTLQGM